jgi:hypothetical protein
LLSVLTREKILERIEDALGMVNQYLEDLKDGFRMHPGVGVGTYFDLRLEAAPPLSAQLPSRSHNPIHGFPNSLFDQLYLPGWSSSLAGGGNFIPAESRRTQRNSWRFFHARFREDLDASSSSSAF